MLQSSIEREAILIEIRDGKAFVPFDVDGLYWLREQFSLRDEYRQVLSALIKKMESESTV